MSVTEPRMDPETLAAFLEGKLAPQERARVLAQLAASPADTAQLLEAARVRAALEAASASSGAFEAPRKARWPMIVTALAAVLIAAIAIGRFSRPRSPEILVLASALRVPDTGTDWSAPPWDIERGAPGSLSEQATVFRIGARLVDLEVAAGGPDTTAARRITRDLVTLVSRLPAGGPAAAHFDRLGIDAGAVLSARQRATAARAVRELVEGSPWLDLGGWLEAARIAGAAGDSVFFASGSKAHSILTRLRDSPPDPGVGPALGRIERIAPRVGASDGFTQLRILVDSLLVALAR